MRITKEMDVVGISIRMASSMMVTGYRATKKVLDAISMAMVSIWESVT